MVPPLAFCVPPAPPWAPLRPGPCAPGSRVLLSWTGCGPPELSHASVWFCLCPEPAMFSESSSQPGPDSVESLIKDWIDKSARTLYLFLLNHFPQGQGDSLKPRGLALSPPCFRLPGSGLAQQLLQTPPQQVSAASPAPLGTGPLCLWQDSNPFQRCLVPLVPRFRKSGRWGLLAGAHLQGTVPRECPGLCEWPG